MWFFQYVIAAFASPAEGAALVCFAPGKPNANQIMTGNNSGRAPVNHKAVNIMAQPRLAIIRLPSPRAFASNKWSAAEGGMRPPRFRSYSRRFETRSFASGRLQNVPDLRVRPFSAVPEIGTKCRKTPMTGSWPEVNAWQISRSLSRYNGASVRSSYSKSPYISQHGGDTSRGTRSSPRSNSMRSGSSRLGLIWLISTRQL